MLLDVAAARLAPCVVVSAFYAAAPVAVGFTASRVKLLLVTGAVVTLGDDDAAPCAGAGWSRSHRRCTSLALVSPSLPLALPPTAHTVYHSVATVAGEGWGCQGVGKGFDIAPRSCYTALVLIDRRYRLICVPADYPFPFRVLADGTKLAFEHRVIVERSMGRYLVEGEVVHHIDGNPQNNALSNLHLYASQAEHLADAHGSISARGAAASLCLPL